MLEKIIVVGSNPPPIGGNTIHVQRLVTALRAIGFEAIFIDYRPISIGKGISFSPLRIISKVQEYLAQEARLPRGSIVHVHVSALKRFRWFAPVIFRVFRKHSIVVTIHSGSFVSDNAARREQVYRLFSNFSHIIAVSNIQAEFLMDVGIPPDNISVIPAYLPSSLGDATVPISISRLKDQPIVLTSGQLLPIYNYEVLLDAIDKAGIEKHFVFAFYGARDSEYAHGIFDRIQKMRSGHSITVVEDADPESFLAILDYSDTYVRTTRTDGDAVAIREAIQLKKNVIATNVVSRPAECALFSVDDSTELAQLLRSEAHHNQETVHSHSNLDAIVKVYHKVTGSNSASVVWSDEMVVRQ